ncbi:MAG TPA: hypothetical protein VJ574_04235 [Candidatus Bathyarchaeia archaeon]|nr:hypothetical protein [Candidatus Bathyarchaeia archaeon]
MEPQKNDPLDTVSIGIAIISLAIIMLTYPNTISLVVEYLRELGVRGYPFMPSYALARPLIMFLNIFGAWSMIEGGLRLVFMMNPRRMFLNVAGGVFPVFLAYILNQHYLGLVRLSTLIPLAIAGLGILIIANILATHLVPFSAKPPTVKA